MISETALLLKMRKESRLQRNELPTPFMKGVVHGLHIAISIVIEVSRETQNIREEYRGRLNRWSAARFKQSIHTALNYMNRGDRARGIRILEKAAGHERQPYNVDKVIG